MSECKYSKCDKPADDGSQFCGKSHRAQHSKENKVARNRVAQSLRDERNPGQMTRLDDQTMVGPDGKIYTTYEDGSVLTFTADQPTSQCFQDSGIPLPGDPGYKGVCSHHFEQKRWMLHPNRLRMSRAEMLTRYANATV